MTNRLPIPPTPPQGPSSHLQQPRGPADASRLLSVSEAKVGSVDVEDTSLTDGEDDWCCEPLITAAPVLWEPKQQISYCAAHLQRQHTTSGLKGCEPQWTDASVLSFTQAMREEFLKTPRNLYFCPFYCIASLGQEIRSPSNVENGPIARFMNGPQGIFQKSCEHI